MKLCQRCSGTGRQLITGAIQGQSKLLCPECDGSGRAEGMDITVWFQTEGYPRSGYNSVTLQIRSLDTTIRVNLSLRETQALRDRLEEMLHKFWSESDGENPHRQQVTP